jgi:1-acyl-sn-glycerol-3-phosphate acyltransferase
MLHFLPSRLKGTLSFLLIVINTIIIFIPLMVIAAFKLVLPVKSIRNGLSKLLILIANQWVRFNAWNFKLLNRIHWDVQGLQHLKKNEWCLIISNHQTWVDILVLQTNLLKRIPYIKFFLKKELIWVPFMGLAWWALDFPFMKRYSRSFLEKNPHLKGRDVEVTRKACEKFKNSPIAVMNFVEGTRFTPEKHQKQQSPFNNLLKPKAGGVAFILGAMGDYLDCILNITIAYPGGVPDFWDFLCGRVSHIKMIIEKTAVTPNILGNYDTDKNFQAEFQTWVNDLWVKKDSDLDYLLLPPN